jgi:hypothetical protein
LSNPKWRPIEIQRQQRLVSLYNWGKKEIPVSELFETVALHRLINKAEESYPVTYPTALGYARQVLMRLRKEAMPAQ